MKTVEWQPAERPVLVTGTIRSGTTWLGRVLATCDNAFYIHEPFNPDSLWNAAFPTPIQHYYLCEANGVPYKSLFRRIILLNPRFKGRWKKDVCEHQTKHIRAHTRHLDPNRPFNPIIKDPTALYSCEWLFDNFNVNPVIVLRNPVSIIKSLLRLNWASKLNGSAIHGQPLLLKRLCAIDPRFAVYGEEKTWAAADAFSRAINFVRFNYLFVAAMKKAYPQWHYVNYEQLINSNEKLLDLISGLKLVPTRMTKDTLSNEVDGFDPELPHQKTLKPHPVDLETMYADDGSGVDWRGFYTRDFGFVADAFPQFPYLAVPDSVL